MYYRGEMELTDNKLTEADSGMGNEVSQTEGVKQSVGGGGKVGQFQRVLVESEYSIPDLREPTEDVSRDQAATIDVSRDQAATSDVHDQATLKLRGERGSELKADNSRTNDKQNSDPAEQTKLDADPDYSLIEECKALITEAADRAVQRSLSRNSTCEQVTDLDEIHVGETVEKVEIIEQAKSVSELKVEPILPRTSYESTYSEIPDGEDIGPTELKNETIQNETAELVKGSQTDRNYALKCGIITESAEDIFDSNKKQKKGKKQKSKSADDIFQREVIESVKEHFDSKDNLDLDKPTPEAKRPKGGFIAKMFKFSKKKPKTEADASVEIKHQIKNDIVEENDSEINDQSAKPASVEISNGGQSSHKARQVKRLNSLDSGIVVDKVIEQPSNTAVEYAVVQKTKTKNLVEADSEGVLQEGTTEIIQTVSKETETDQATLVTDANTSDQKEAVYVNGDKTDEDYVYVNERAVDVGGLEELEQKSASETVHQDSSVNMSKINEKSMYEDERRSNVSTDSGTSSGSKVRRSDILTQPEKAKLKKKSWSFQLVGKKKQADEQESGSVVSMDPSASQTESKKPKWRFGKFSFRRDSDEVSSSTPNLHNVGIPEGEEVTLRKKPEDKKKMKLKQLKAKKDKKKSPDKNRSSLDTRSTSLIDIGRGELLEPRSRRSIVEEDLPFTQTDVFEGVSLSDLSQDEENEEVSNNPAGGSVSEKKVESKKPNAKMLGKVADKVIDIVGTKADKLSKQSCTIASSSDIKTEKTDETKLERINSNEDSKAVAVNLSEKTLTQSCSCDQGNTEDEYVNIVPAKAEIVQCVSSDKGIAEDAEYAQVIKTKNKLVEVSEDKNVQKFKSAIPEQVLKLDIVDVSNAEKSEDNKSLQSMDINKVNKDINEHAEELKTNQNVQKSGDVAFSNMIYSDEEFNAAKRQEQSKNEPDDESGAYVELQQIVEDFSHDKDVANSAVSPVLENQEMEVISTNSVDEKAEIDKIVDKSATVTKEEIVKTESALQENVLPVETVDKSEILQAENVPTKLDAIARQTELDTAESMRHVCRDASVLVVKDVGVQVPDIYMPLDKDKDFSYTVNNIPCVSVGIQVGEKDFEVEHVVVSLKTNEDTNTQKELSPAFF